MGNIIFMNIFQGGLEAIISRGMGGIAFPDDTF
jgi:hypothetical protein